MTFNLSQNLLFTLFSISVMAIIFVAFLLLSLQCPVAFFGTSPARRFKHFSENLSFAPFRICLMAMMFAASFVLNGTFTFSCMRLVRRLLDRCWDRLSLNTNDSEKRFSTYQQHYIHFRVLVDTCMDHYWNSRTPVNKMNPRSASVQPRTNRLQLGCFVVEGGIYPAGGESVLNNA